MDGGAERGGKGELGSPGANNILLFNSRELSHASRRSPPSHSPPQLVRLIGNPVRASNAGQPLRMQYIKFSTGARGPLLPWRRPTLLSTDRTRSSRPCHPRLLRSRLGNLQLSTAPSLHTQQQAHVLPYLQLTSPLPACAPTRAPLPPRRRLRQRARRRRGGGRSAAGGRPTQSS